MKNLVSIQYAAPIVAPNVEQTTFPVTMSKAGKPDKIVENQSDYDEALELKYTVKTSTTTNLTKKKRRLTFEEACTMQDSNLAESLGVPSQLVTDARGNLPFTFEATVLEIVEQKSRRTGNEFPSTQVDYKGTSFCVLFDQSKHAIGTIAKFKVVEAAKNDDGTFVTRSGMSIETI